VLHLEFIGMMIVYVVEYVNKNLMSVQRVLWIDMVFHIANMIIQGKIFLSLFLFFFIFLFSFRRFFYQCFACQKNLLRNDLIQRAKSNMYHVDCFLCEAFRKCLQTGDGKNMILFSIKYFFFL